MKYLFSDEAIQLNDAGAHINYASATPKYYYRTTAGVQCSSQNRRVVNKVVEPMEQYDPITMLPIIETGMNIYVFTYKK